MDNFCKKNTIVLFAKVDVIGEVLRLSLLDRIPACEISLLKNPGFGELLYLGLRVYTTGSFD